MFIDKTELERRLKSPKNLINSLDNMSIHNSPPFTNSAARQAKAPVLVRATAGALALQSSVKEVAEEFSLPIRQVRESTNSRDPEVKDRVTGALDRVRELAIDKLMESLGLLTEEKISKGSAKDISTVAANMGRVVDRVTPKQVGGNVQLIVYAPTQREVKEFDVVDV